MQWRPVTGIRAVDDPDWTPLLVTPPFPDYPAAHTTYAGAAETVLSGLFDVGPAHAHRRRCRAALPRLRGIADEVEGARVWGGVHWRTSSETGRALGDRVGGVAVRRMMSRAPASG